MLLHAQTAYDDLFLKAAGLTDDEPNQQHM
jgi:hypothetical protein